MAGRARRVAIPEGAVVLSPADVAGLNRYLDRIEEYERRRNALIARMDEVVGREPGTPGRLEELAEVRENLEQGRRDVVGVLFELRGYLGGALGRELP